MAEKTFNRFPEKYGENVVSAILHADEVGNIHIHAMVIPIDEKGHLNSYAYVDGPKVMSELLTSYAKAMERFGLKHPPKGIPSRHEDIRKFYSALNNAVAAELPTPEHGESFIHYYDRLDAIYKEAALKIFSLENENKKLKVSGTRMDLEEKLEFESQKIELSKKMQAVKEQEEELIRERELYKSWNDDPDLARKKIQRVDDLIEALKTHDDQNFAHHIDAGIGELLRQLYDKRKRSKGKNIDLNNEKVQ